MKSKTILLCGAAATLAIASVPANAANIILVDQGGVTGSAAAQGFQIAANYWSSILTNNATIYLGVKYSALPTGVIGSTGSRRIDQTVASWESRINATKSNSAIDQNIVLPSLTGGGASFITNGVSADGTDDTSTQQYIAGTSGSSQVLYQNSALLKALGVNVASPTTLDGNVSFSSTFAFDFNPSDGIDANTFDFIGVAIHEIGHALGFVSGVDFLDYYGDPNGPGRNALTYSLNDTSIYSALDMFRYSNDPNNLAPGNGPSLDLAVGGTKYFSVDGGATALYGNTMSTGAYNGDGRQASHWKDTSSAQGGCVDQIGIMDPTFCFGQMGVVKGLDLAAFDAIGWNLSVAANQNYSRSTAQIYLAAIPEPATWAMMIAGFGFIGGSMRVRRRSVSFAAA
ncbi:MAG: NF038122 family metalloprotease [Sphingomonadales bacterium]